MPAEPNASSHATKRYRFTGQERDEESSLTYHGARYYAPWTAQWTSPDPKGMVDGTNLYGYSRNNPVNRTDKGGGQSEASNKTDEQKATKTKKDSSDSENSVIWGILEGVKDHFSHFKDIDELARLSNYALLWDDIKDEARRRLSKLESLSLADPLKGLSTTFQSIEDLWSTAVRMKKAYDEGDYRTLGEMGTELTLQLILAALLKKLSRCLT